MAFLTGRQDILKNLSLIFKIHPKGIYLFNVGHVLFFRLRQFSRLICSLK